MRVDLGEGNEKRDKLDKKCNDTPTKTSKGDPSFGC